MRVDWGWNYVMREVWRSHAGGVGVSCEGCGSLMREAWKSHAGGVEVSGRCGSLIRGCGSLMLGVEVSGIKLSRVFQAIDN